MASTVMVGVLAAAVVGCVTRAAAARDAPAAAMVLAIGVSRLYLSVHWLTDALVDWLLGGA